MILYLLCRLAMLLIPVGGSVLFYVLLKRTGLKALPVKRKSVVAGLYFGLLAIAQSGTGVFADLLYQGKSCVSSPNMVPVCAGLFFDGTAGILSALIGAAYRFLSFSRASADPVLVSEVFSTLATGISVFLIRRYLLRNREPSTVFCWCTALAASALPVLFYPLVVALFSSHSASLSVSAVSPRLLSNTLTVYITLIAIRKLNTGRFFPPAGASAHERRYNRIAIGALILIVTVTSLVSGFSNAALIRQLIDAAIRADVEDIVTVLNEQPAFSLPEISKGFHVYNTGYCIIADQEGIILADAGTAPEERVTLQEIGVDLHAVSADGASDTAAVHGVRSLLVHKNSEKYIVVGVVSEDDAYSYLSLQSMLTLSTTILLLYSVALLINIMLRLQTAYRVKLIRSKLGKVISPEQITEEAGVFSFLDHSATEYMNGIVTRISDEMKFAADIQVQALPLPDAEFAGLGIHALIRPARQIGGDFYDYFPIDAGRTAMVIADVSGKGISAAMFMMRVKAAIRGAVSEDATPENFLQKVNAILCEGNEDNMFVTLWLGIITHGSGLLHYINAGQGTQMLRHPGGEYEAIPGSPGIPLGLRSGWKPVMNTLQLRSGSRLFLCTDGVTEANDVSDRLFGEERLLEALNADCKAVNGKNTVNAVAERIAGFSEGAEQSDDITMLCVDYFRQETVTPDHSSILTVPALDENLDRAWGFIENALESVGCSPSLMMEVNVAFEEVFVNVCHYAYPHGSIEAPAPSGSLPGSVSVEVTVAGRVLTVRLSDSGIPFNPLYRKKQSSSLTLRDRKEGGLGITLVKECMDYVEYEYADGKNIFTMLRVLC